MFKRPLAILFAVVFSLCVLILDFTAVGPTPIWGLYGWAAVAFAAVLVFWGGRTWFTVKSLAPPGLTRPREAVFFIAGVVASVSLTARAMAALPAANSFTLLPNWPPLYLFLFLLLVGGGAYVWLSGRRVFAWALFALLFLGGANGQLFNLAAGGYGLYFGFTAVVFFFQSERLGAGQPRLSYVGVAAIIFIAALAAGAWWSQDWAGSFRTVYFLANGFLLFVILAREIGSADTLALPAPVVWALLLTATAFEVSLAAKFVMVVRWIPLNIPPQELFWTMGVPRNALTAYFVAAVPLLILAAKSPRPVAPRWLLWGQVALTAAVPALTLAKSAILGLLVVLWFVFAFSGTERRMNLKLLASAAVALFVVVVLLLVVFIPGGPARFLKAAAYTAPLMAFKAAFEALRAHLVTGVGIGSAFGWAAQARALSPAEWVAYPELLAGRSDSLLLEIVGATGLLGTIAFFILLQTATWAGATLVKVEADRFFFGMVSASLAGAAAILAVAQGLALLSPIPLILFVGLAMYEGGIRRRGLAAPSPTWLTAVFTVLVVVATALGLARVAGGQELARGEALFKRGAFGDAAACFARSARITPWEAEPLGRLGACYLAEEGGDLDAARRAYGGAARRARGDSSYLERLGLLYWAAGEEEAGTYLARAVEADPAGVFGGPTQVSYALYLASRGDTAGARRLLAEAVIADPRLCRSVAFVNVGPAGTLRTYLRPAPLLPGGRLAPEFLFALLGVRGYEASSYPRRAAGVPPAFERDLELEEVYAAEYRRADVAPDPASPLAYRLGEGYAETRSEGRSVFAEVEELPGVSPREEAVAWALGLSAAPAVEPRRSELQSLLGLALLARRSGEAPAAAAFAAAFVERAAEVGREFPAGGAGERAYLDRLKYNRVHDERPEWNLTLAEASLLQGRPREARRYFDRAVELLLAAEVDARDERLARAVRGVLQSEALVALAGGAPREPALPPIRVASPAAYAALARAAEFRGEYKDALLTLRGGVAAYPRDAGLRWRLAEFYERRGKDDKAGGVLAAAEAPRELELWRSRAQLLARSGAREKAEVRWAETEGAFPGDLVTYVGRARGYREDGEVGKAREILETARERVPPGSLWASRYGETLLAADDPEGAAAYYGEARRLNPFDLEPYVVWGSQLCRQGEEEGLELLRAAVALAPASSWARRELAAGYLHLGREAEAEAVYREGVRLEGPGSPITLLYDDYYRERNDGAGRRRVLTAALARDPVNATLRARLGEVAMAEGNAEEGFRLLHEAVTLEPTAAGANAALGFYYRARREAATAVPYLERARAAAPRNEKYRVLLAEVYVETGRNREALAELAAVTAPAWLPKALVLQAKAYYNLGERSAAAEAARRALELDPACSEAQPFITE
ncbi:MAG: hypothetical protein JSU81_07255 [Candidatus Coatesbacteria bacterium]|nr:MAG: hypothetical protein JSU81_07255 [Candidatus Coatesbacteria bacterium]